MDIEIPPAYTLYEAVGTGPEKPEIVNRDRYFLRLNGYGGNIRPKNFLKNAVFEAEIHAWIDETIENLPQWVDKNDFVPAINKVIAYDIRSAANMVYTDYTMKCDFFGLCEGFSFDLDNIYMPEDNAYFIFPDTPNSRELPYNKKIEEAYDTYYAEWLH
jgi:hypothetical protein